MARGTGETQARAVDVAAVAGAATLSLVIVSFVGWSLMIGIAQEAWRSLSASPTCSSSMRSVLTLDGDHACIEEGTRLPRGWIVLREAD